MYEKLGTSLTQKISRFSLFCGLNSIAQAIDLSGREIGLALGAILLMASPAEAEKEAVNKRSVF